MSPSRGNQPHHLRRRLGGAGQRPPRLWPQPLQPLTAEPGQILVIALPADPQPGTHLRNRLPASLHRGEHRRVLGLHRDFLTAHRGTLLDKPLGVTDVLSATCYRCPVSWHTLQHVHRACNARARAFLTEERARGAGGWVESAWGGCGGEICDRVVLRVALSMADHGTRRSFRGELSPPRRPRTARRCVLPRR